jgi:hypothetical protein
MDKMIEIKPDFNGKFSLQTYPNGQMAVFYKDFESFPIAELSLMNDSVELDQNEFILKDYSENSELIENLLSHEIIMPTDRFVLIEGHICPICKLF